MSSNKLQAFMDRLDEINQAKIEELNLMGTTDPQQQKQMLNSIAMGLFISGKESEGSRLIEPIISDRSKLLNEISEYSNRKQCAERRKKAWDDLRRLSLESFSLNHLGFISDSDYAVFIDNLWEEANKTESEVNADCSSAISYEALKNSDYNESEPSCPASPVMIRCDNRTLKNYREWINVRRKYIGNNNKY